MIKEEELISLIKSSLGYPVVEVHMTDEMIKAQIDYAVKVFSSKVFKEDIIVSKVQNQINLSKYKVAFIMEVNPVELKKEYSDYIYERNEFSLMESMMYFNTTDTSLATPILAQILRNQMLYVFNAKFDWFYNSETGVLFLDSVPISVREVAITAKCYYTFDTIPAYADDWLIDFSLCRAKQVEGRIRSKYQDTIPGAPTDGESLISEGKQDEDTLKEKLESFVPLDIGMRW